MAHASLPPSPSVWLVRKASHPPFPSLYFEPPNSALYIHAHLWIYVFPVSPALTKAPCVCPVRC